MRAMNSYYYDFKLDKNGPHKVSIEIRNLNYKDYFICLMVYF